LLVLCLWGGIWLEVVEWAMLVPDCIVLCIAIFAFIENATHAAQNLLLGAFFANLFGSKYQMYAVTYRGRGAEL
jgi:hypothetical protein